MVCESRLVDETFVSEMNKLETSSATYYLATNINKKQLEKV